MIKLVLTICFVLGGSGAALYISKQTVDSRFDNLRSLQKEIREAKERLILGGMGLCYPS